MNLILAGSLAAASLLLASCGTATYPNATGTWTMAAVSGVVLNQPPQHFAGTLASSEDTITGTLTFSNSCFHSQALTYTGTISTAAAIKMTSTSYNNQTVTLTGTLSPDGSLLTSGSYTVTATNLATGYCDTGDTGSLTGSRQ